MRNWVVLKKLYPKRQLGLAGIALLGWGPFPTVAAPLFPQELAVRFKCDQALSPGRLLSQLFDENQSVDLTAAVIQYGFYGVVWTPKVVLLDLSQKGEETFRRAFRKVIGQPFRVNQVLQGKAWLSREQWIKVSESFYGLMGRGDLYQELPGFFELVLKSMIYQTFKMFPKNIGADQDLSLEQMNTVRAWLESRFFIESYQDLNQPGYYEQRSIPHFLPESNFYRE